MHETITNDRKLLLFIQYVPLTLLVVFTLVIVGVLVNENRISLEEDLNSLRENFQTTQQENIRNRVNNVVEQIEFEKKRTERALKQSIQQRVTEALNIANNIYRTYHETDPEVAKRMILAALDPIRFNQGRGYFFVYRLDGTNLLLPINPELQGQNLWDVQDQQGQYVIRQLTGLAHHHQQGFHQWYWGKPSDPHGQHKKIGYVAHFQPYNWMIGSGEYVEDFEANIQKTLIERISDYRYENNDYVFILNSKGALLSHPNPNLIGVERLDAEDKAGKKYIKQIVDKGLDGGGFVRYHSSYSPMGTEDSYKMSFVNYLPDWDWVIGTGVYLKPHEDFLAQREADMIESNRRELNQVLMASAVVSAILMAMSLWLGKRVGRRYSDLHRKISQDFNQLQSAKSKLQYQATHDGLTDLPNRFFLVDFINEAIRSSSTQAPNTAIMFVDIDDFKKVNDAFGHTVGDQMLTYVGQKFMSLLSETQMVARFGGDEFVFCFPHLTCVTEAEHIAQQISDVFKEELCVGGKVITSSCSIGVSIYPQDGLNPEELITRADTALYTSKARRKGRILFFDDSINQTVQYELTLENELRHAISKNELYLTFQPQLSLATGKIESVEALLRWHNPELGHVSPLELIRKAEEIGLIHQIGEYVIRESCSLIAKHFPDSENPIGLSINISPSQFVAKNFVHQLKGIVDEHGLSHDRITVEITENVLIDDLDYVTPILNQIRSQGFAVSLDDFGTGFSSLSYLCNLPINEIKIDRSFVDKMLINEQSDALVKAIIAIGKSHSLKVVAEGIETSVQNEQLMNYQCNLGQGYYFAKPLKIEELVSFVSTSR